MDDTVKAELLGLKRNAVENQEYINSLAAERTSTLEWRRKQLFGLNDDALRAVASLCQTVHDASTSQHGADTEDQLEVAFPAIQALQIESKCASVRTSLERLETAYADLLAANESTSLKMSQCYNGRFLDMRCRIDAVNSKLTQNFKILTREEIETKDSIQKLKTSLQVLESDLGQRETKDQNLYKHQKKAKKAKRAQWGIAAGSFVVGVFFPPAMLIATAAVAGGTVSNITTRSIGIARDIDQCKTDQLRSQIAALEAELRPIQDKHSLIVQQKQDSSELRITSTALLDECKALKTESQDLQVELNQDKDCMQKNILTFLEISGCSEMEELLDRRFVVTTTRDFARDFLLAAQNIQERTPISESDRTKTEGLSEKLIGDVGKLSKLLNEPQGTYLMDIEAPEPVMDAVHQGLGVLWQVV